MQIVQQRPYQYYQRANGERIDWIPTVIEGYTTAQVPKGHIYLSSCVGGTKIKESKSSGFLM